MPPNAKRKWSTWAPTIGLLVCVWALAVVSSRPPKPRASSSPLDQFSGLRAREVLERIVADGAPHPAGSVAGAAMQVRIASELGRLGLRAEVLESFACDALGTCSSVRNVFASLSARPGAPADKAVLLVAHYDSVLAGPGVSDN